MYSLFIKYGDQTFSKLCKGDGKGCAEYYIDGPKIKCNGEMLVHSRVKTLNAAYKGIQKLEA